MKEIYGELSIPLVQDHFLMKDVSLDTSYRWSDYNLAGTSGTYKFGGDWAVDHDIRFRGGFARTERAPNVLELFTPPTVGNCYFSDPCSGAKNASTGLIASGYTAAQCYRDRQEPRRPWASPRPSSPRSTTATSRPPGWPVQRQGGRQHGPEA